MTKARTEMGYWILVWDAWGPDLNMIGARLYQEKRGTGLVNWWSDNDADSTNDEWIDEVERRHNLHGQFRGFYKIITS